MFSGKQMLYPLPYTQGKAAEGVVTMAIPDYQSCMKPMLQILAKESEMRLRQLNEALADHFGLTEEERAVLLPSGRQQVYRNRGGWAKTYLLKAGLIESTRRGYAQITDEGRAVLQRNPDSLNTRYLRDHFAAFRDFQQASRPDKNHETDVSSTVDDQVESGEDEITPEERLEQSYQRLRSELVAELLDRIHASTPEFFEQLVVRLMVAMGYGGTLKDAGQAVGKSGDEGIDGVIKEDRLGLDVIYLQAKRWANPVGRPEVQKFVGALHGKQARKGVFITTSNFTHEADDYARVVETKLILLDGERLANLMIDFGVGVTTVATYELKRVDSDFFGEE